MVNGTKFCEKSRNVIGLHILFYLNIWISLAVFSMVLSGGAAFGIYFVKTATDNLILGCIFGAVSTMGFNALDCLGAELFPTHLRYVLRNSFIITYIYLYILNYYFGNFHLP